MATGFERPIDLPYIADDHELAATLLEVFNVSYGDYDVAEEALAELTDDLANSLTTIRNHPFAHAYRSEPCRLPDGTWLGELWWLMWPLGFIWLLEIDQGELPAGPFPEPELGHRPAANTGADFIYMALKAMGLRFIDEEFRDQFHVMVADLRRELSDGSDADEDEDEVE